MICLPGVKPLLLRRFSWGLTHRDAHTSPRQPGFCGHGAAYTVSAQQGRAAFTGGSNCTQSQLPLTPSPGPGKGGPRDPRGRVSWSPAHLLTCSPAPAICSDPDLRDQSPPRLPPSLPLSPEASMGTQDAHKHWDQGIEYQWQLLLLLGGWERLF